MSKWGMLLLVCAIGHTMAWAQDFTCRSDVNHDELVDATDFELIRPVWPGLEGFQADLDVNQNQVIDVMDLIWVLNSDGMQCSTGPTIAGCSTLPLDNIWNTPINTSPVDAQSDAYITTIGADKPFHMDFGSGTWDGAPIGIPYVVVDGTQPLVDIDFLYADESDPGPYPIPDNPPIEGGPASDGDRHVLIVDQDNCMLYEIYRAFPQGDGTWFGDSGAVFDLNSNLLRPDTWTSADAAGLPILPGLVRYDEIEAGEIKHAVRFTAPQTQNSYVWPARHKASSHSEAYYPPMGIRVRLKASYNITGFSPEIQIILQALKTYGMILADNGSAWYISGAPDERWNNDHLHEMDALQGSDFEVVNVTGLRVDPDSGQASPP